MSIAGLLLWLLYVAGKRVTEDEVENMIESDNPAIFTQDVSFITYMYMKYKYYVVV